MNWIAIAVAVLFVAFIVYLIATKQWERLKRIAYILMLEAERIYSDNQGALKFSEVFGFFYHAYLPKWLKFILSEQYIRDRLQQWYDEGKEYLSVYFEDGDI